MRVHGIYIAAGWVRFRVRCVCMVYTSPRVGLGYRVRGVGCSCPKAVG